MVGSFDLKKTGKSAAIPAGRLTPIPPLRSLEPRGSARDRALYPPTAPAPVEEHEALDSVKLELATFARLDAMVSEVVVAIATLPPKDARFKKRLADIRTLGDSDVKPATERINRVLHRPASPMREGGAVASLRLTESLAAFRKQIEALDPDRQEDLFGSRRLLGVIHVGDKLGAYFLTYHASQDQIDAAFAEVAASMKLLAADSEELRRERASLWQLTERLRQDIYLAGKLDATLRTRIGMIETADPRRAETLRQLLPGLEQKTNQLSHLLAAAVAGCLCIDVMRQADNGLARGMERAVAAMVGALQTAVTTARSMTDQKLTLDHIAALHDPVNDTPRTPPPAADRLPGNGERSSGLEPLRAAFATVYTTLDDIDTFWRKTVETIHVTAQTMEEQIEGRGRERQNADTPEPAQATEPTDVALTGAPEN